MKNKKIILGTIIALMVLSGSAAFFTAKKASAGNSTVASGSTSTDTTTTASTDDTTESQAFADKLAAKLGVDSSKVKTALDELKGERQAERKAKVSANLDQAVKDGVITSDQKQKIIDKQAEIQKQRDQNKSDMQNWAKENGIDLTKLRGYLGFHGNKK